MSRLIAAARRTFSSNQGGFQKSGPGAFKTVKSAKFGIDKWHFPSFGVLSDTHTDFYHEIPSKMEKHLNDLASLTPWLVLAGDISRPSHPLYRGLLKTVSRLFRQVILVSGNHEYYRKPPGCDREPQHASEEEKEESERHNLFEAKAEEQIRAEISGLTNVHFLQREGATLEWRNSSGVERIHFLGCTLWSTPPQWMWKGLPQMMGVSWEKYVKMHQRDKEWLEETLLELNREKSTRGEKKVVVTHHLPSFQMVHEKYKDFYSGMHASSQENLLRLADVWVCGHSHAYVRKKINGCLCVLNPYGYPKEESGFRRGLVEMENLDLETSKSL